MKKKNILVVILVFIGLITFIITAISGQNQATSEARLKTVITNFLAGDYVWDISEKKLYYPDYMDVEVSDEYFLITIPVYKKDYNMFYSTGIKEPDFFIETPKSDMDSTHAEFADIFSVCKRLQYDTCFLKISNETILIKTIRIFRDGNIEAKDSSGTWHKKITCNNFILT